MARRLFNVVTFTPTAVNDGTNMTDGTHMTIQGGSSTQATYITEVFLGGQATASAPAILQLARHSQVATSPTALAGPNSVEPSHPASADLALPAVCLIASSANKAQADANAKLINLSYNAFGGLVRKSWNPFEGPWLYGNTASFGELGINGYTGSSASALMGGHIEYETL